MVVNFDSVIAVDFDKSASPRSASTANVDLPRYLKHRNLLLNTMFDLDVELELHHPLPGHQGLPRPNTSIVVVLLDLPPRIDV